MNSSNNENNNNGDDVNDHDQIDFNNQTHHDTLITVDKLPSMTAITTQSLTPTTTASDTLIDTLPNGNVESIYGNCNQSLLLDENGVGDGFTYKTLNGDVIRSVHPPGKGSSFNYKVSEMCLLFASHLIRFLIFAFVSISCFDSLFCFFLNFQLTDFPCVCI